MIPVKICGITSLHDAELAATFGASAVGFIFYEKSPRYISPEKAKEIAVGLPLKICRVGVFVNAREDNIHRISKFVGLDFIQLHGDETAEFCHRMAVPVIKALRIRERLSGDDYQDYDVHAFLLDTYQPDLHGGTGSSFNWTLVKRAKFERPFILSGGLNPENVLHGINEVHPAAIDVNSGVETSPGKKDETKLRALFEVLRKRNEYPNIFHIEPSQS